MALYSDQIDEIVRRDYKAKRFFGGVYSSDTLPDVRSLPMGLIVNFDEASKPGSHWVGIWLTTSGQAIYFDSFGFPPAVAPPAISKFLQSYHTVYNDKMLQHFSADTCGYYTILFIILCSRNLALLEIQSLFLQNAREFNDLLVKIYIRNHTIQ
jgi:hypothetical protein